MLPIVRRRRTRRSSWHRAYYKGCGHGPTQQYYAALRKRFSVLIPTYNRAELLPGLLDSWDAIEEPDGGHEIMLADDGSQTDVQHIVAPYEAKMPLRFLRLPHGGVAAARQAALENSCGDYVLITDDDCRPAPGLLRAYEGAIGNFPERALGGPVINLLECNIYAEATQAAITYVTQKWNSKSAGPVFFTGSNILLPRSSLLSIGGFDRSWLCRTGEDRDLCRRWAEAGLKMAYVQGAVMGHAHTLHFAAFLRQHFHYGQGRWWSERRRQRKGAGAPAWSGPGFYAGLVLSPFRTFSYAKAARIALLLVCAQAATAAGSLQARLALKNEGL